GNGILKAATGRSTPLSTSISKSSFQQFIPPPAPKKTFKDVITKAFHKERNKWNTPSNVTSKDFPIVQPLQKRNSVMELHGTTAYHSPIKIRIDNPPDSDDDTTQNMVQSMRSVNPIVLDKSSVIRQNLLGPLSFDDLYYT
ncbi:hypothetical protein Tcan_13311, partial [Toxocara canis]